MNDYATVDGIGPRVIEVLYLGFHCGDFIPVFYVTLRKADFLLYFAEFIELWFYAILHRPTY